MNNTLIPRFHTIRCKLTDYICNVLGILPLDNPQVNSVKPGEQPVGKTVEKTDEEDIDQRADTQKKFFPGLALITHFRHLNHWYSKALKM